MNLAAAVGLALAGCAGSPLLPLSTDTPPLVLMPAAQAAAQDKRGRFREIYCTVLQARAGEVPDHRACDDALTRLGTELVGTGQVVRWARRAADWSPQWLATRIDDSV